MTIEDRIRETLVDKADRLPEPDSVRTYPLPAAPTRHRLSGLWVAVASFVATLVVIGIGLMVLGGLGRTAQSPAQPATTTAGDEPGLVDQPVEYALGPDAGGWEIRDVVEDRDGNKQVTLLDMSAGPAEGEGVLPSLSIWVGPAADRQLARVEDGTGTVEWTFQVDGAEAAVIASGTDAVGLDSGVVVWRSSYGQAVMVEYGRLSHDEAERLLQLVEPIDQSEWDSLVAEGESPSTTTTLIESPTEQLSIDSVANSLNAETMSDGELGSTTGLPPNAGQAGYRINQVFLDNGTIELGLILYKDLLVEEGDEYICIHDYAMTDGVMIAGGSQCAATPEKAIEMAGFGIAYSGACGPIPKDNPQVTGVWALLTIWGIPARVDTVDVGLIGGDSTAVEVSDQGVAQMLWEDPKDITSIQFEGMTSSQTEYVNRVLPASVIECTSGGGS